MLTEIGPGLLLHLDPDTLESGGGTYTCEPSRRVRGPHFFLCIAATATGARWLPLYSEAGVGRTEIPQAGRTGHPKWTNGTFFYHRAQVWSAGPSAVAAAAAAASDLSQPGQRNRLASTCIPSGL